MRNMAASVNQRLLNLARAQQGDFQRMLTRYALERLLYRLALSPHTHEFVVKGALLFTLWAGVPHRATRDLDLLGYGSADIARLAQVFRDVCLAPVEDDGLAFHPDSVHGAPIRADQEYGGIRIHLLAMLGNARIPLQVDIGFGDTITPGPESVVFPTLLDMSAPRLGAYPRETVVAEKYQALVHLGMANTRMKDFYDLWLLARNFDFDGPIVSAAIRATFARRQTALPAHTPLALTTTFSEDSAKRTQWSAFLRKGKLEPATLALPEAIAFLALFLLPPLDALVVGNPFPLSWPSQGPWQSPPGAATL